MFDNSEIKALRTRLRRYLGRYLKRAEDADDVAQESFVRVLEAAARGEIRYPRPYLYRTARNLAFNLKARKFNQMESSLEDLVSSDVLNDSGANPEVRVTAQRHFESFCRAVASLPPQCRQVLVLRKVYGFSQKEVAAQLDISVSTVEKHLGKALARCAQFMRAAQEPEIDHAVKPAARKQTPR